MRQDLRIWRGRSIDFDFPSLNEDVSGGVATLQVGPNDLSANLTLGVDGVINLTISDTSALSKGVFSYKLRLDNTFPFEGIFTIESFFKEN